MKNHIQESAHESKVTQLISDQITSINNVIKEGAQRQGAIVANGSRI
tara:strand:- start:3247 stop:3387 length:141 start_codon:yes stop_codon:yes gene_type:complete